MLSISYDNVTLQDGAGAQLQRVIGIFGISKYFHIKYIHNPLAEILVHAGDQVKSESEYLIYKNEINALIPFPSSPRMKSVDRTISIKHLGTKQLLKYLVRYTISSQHINLKVLQPDHIVNRFPGVYKRFRKFQKIFSSEQDHIISVHVRQSGTDSNFILKGESNTRNLPAEYYVEQLKLIRAQIGEINFNNFKILIVTDEPEHITYFNPFGNQIGVWQDAGYPLDQNGFMINPGDVTRQILNHFPNSRVFRGGNPAEAIKVLASGKYLLMSRSSLSVVAGLLSKNSKIIFPPNFWCVPFG